MTNALRNVLVAAALAASFAGAVPATALPSYGYDGNCDVVTADDSALATRVLTVAVYSYPNGQGIAPQRTAVTCIITGAAGTVATVRTLETGPVGVGGTVLTVPLGTYTVCGWVTASFLDGGHAANRPIPCRQI